MKPRLRARPDPVRAALAEARAHGLRERHKTRLANARGRELTHKCPRCVTAIRLIDYVQHKEKCHAKTDPEPPAPPEAPET